MNSNYFFNNTVRSHFISTVEKRIFFEIGTEFLDIYRACHGAYITCRAWLMRRAYKYAQIFPEAVWTLWRRKESYLSGNRTSVAPACNLVIEEMLVLTY
jgi:hypothetical protein